MKLYYLVVDDTILLDEKNEHIVNKTISTEVVVVVVLPVILILVVLSHLWRFQQSKAGLHSVMTRRDDSMLIHICPHFC